MLSNIVLDTIRKHWQGNHSLVFSFWMNLVFLGVLIHILAQLINYLLSSHPSMHVVIAPLFFILSRLVVYPWQAIGVLRACDQAMSEYGNIIWIRAAQLVVILGLIVVFVEGQEVTRTTYMILREMHQPAVRAYTPGKSNVLTLKNKNTLIQIDGPFYFGITRDVADLLSRYPYVEGIILECEGGPVSEGRGLAVLIQKHELDTYSFKECSSACTIVFIAGRKRILGTDAKLGFHQYRLDARNVMPHLDPEAEMKKDLQFFKNQSIDTAFLDQVFKVPHNNIWFPSHTELRTSGVIHTVADLSDVIGLQDHP